MLSTPSGRIEQLWILSIKTLHGTSKDYYAGNNTYANTNNDSGKNSKLNNNQNLSHGCFKQVKSGNMGCAWKKVLHNIIDKVNNENFTTEIEGPVLTDQAILGLLMISLIWIAILFMLLLCTQNLENVFCIILREYLDYSL